MNKKLICIVIFLYTLCASSVSTAEECYVGISNNMAPEFVDDLAWSGIEEALATSIGYYMSQPSEREYNICGRTSTSRQMVETLQEFDSIYRSVRDAGSLKRVLRDRFDVCIAAGGDDRDGRILVTGYFEPVVEGSLVREAPYMYPIYKKPPGLVKSENGIGRMEKGRLIPYWSREEIETKNLLAGEELVYLKDRIEAFILHVQGSGRVRLPDGRVYGIQFAAKNGLPYRSIGKLLVDRGEMDLERVSMPAIIKYLKDHPEEVDEILHHNESYVFFKMVESSKDGPLGSLGRTLIPNRSVAIDNECFSPGALSYLVTRKPLFDKNNSIIGWAPLKRFVFGHDTGSAIKGSGRLDLFTGRGQKARAIAGNLKSSGRLYFLIKKK